MLGRWPQVIPKNCSLVSQQFRSIAISGFAMQGACLVSDSKFANHIVLCCSFLPETIAVARVCLFWSHWQFVACICDSFGSKTIWRASRSLEVCPWEMISCWPKCRQCSCLLVRGSATVQHLPRNRMVFFASVEVIQSYGSNSPSKQSSVISFGTFIIYPLKKTYQQGIRQISANISDNDICQSKFKDSISSTEVVSRHVSRSLDTLSPLDE